MKFREKMLVRGLILFDMGSTPTDLTLVGHMAPLQENALNLKVGGKTW